MNFPEPIPQEVKDPSNFKDGVFYFSNTADEPFVAMWNSVEYIIPAQSCVPMIMPQYAATEIQHIRKVWAKKWAVSQFYSSKEYKRLNKMGRDKPPTYDEDAVLAPYIQKCLTPLPLREVKTAKKRKRTELLGGSKPIGDSLGSNSPNKYNFDAKKEDQTPTDEEINAE